MHSSRRSSLTSRTRGRGARAGWLAVPAGALGFLVLAPGPAGAQQIGGTVTDATGGVLPGVTVEARSPDIIEEVRTAVTDGNGQYLIVALEPGAYAVTYSLPGFGTLIRQGIELSTGFTATIDVQLSVGDIEETVTVSGASPVVDIQNVEQRAVMDREVIDSIPTGKSLTSYGLLVPGMVGAESYGTTLSQDSGGLTSQTSQRMSIHGGEREDQVISINGMDVSDPFTQGANLAYFPDTNFEEIAFNYSANNAEVETGGVAINMIPREGANTFSGALFTTFGLPDLHADNLDDDLRERGLLSATKLERNFTIAPSFGGPIVEDRLWFWVNHTTNFADLQAPGVFHAIDPGAFVFMPDRSRPAIDESTAREQSLNLTWQATPKDKLKLYWTNSAVTKPHYLQGRTLVSIFITPEAAFSSIIRVNTYQAAWTRPHTNRLLFEAGVSHEPFKFDLLPAPGAVTTIPGVLEFSPVRASRNMSGWLSGPTVRYSPKTVNYYRGSMSYVTGSHNLKVGFNLNTQTTSVRQENDGDWTALNTFGGFPIRANFYGPGSSTDDAKPSLGVFAQEQWTVDRLTVNAGVRFDYVNASYPDQFRPPNTWVPDPLLIAGQTVVTWKDFQPRLGVAYDLLGDGRTALKFSAHRYGRRDATDWAQRVNPALSNRRMIRSWNDGLTGCRGAVACVPGDGLVQGNPLDPLPNGEILSPNVTPAFGSPAITAFYDQDWAFGWGNRRANWELSTSIQQELVSGVSLDVGWFRRQWINHSVLDDRAVDSDDFIAASVTVPADQRLPGGGGNTLRFYDLRPESVGVPDEIRTHAGEFGDQTEVWNGFDVTVDARVENVLLQGGLSTGSWSHDYCAIQSALPESVGNTALSGAAAIPQRSEFGDTAPLDFCKRSENWLTQVKFLGSYTFPGDVQVAATLQNQPGPERAAEVRFTETSLGRPATLYPGTVTLNVIPPGTVYGERFNQLDLRVTKIFSLAGSMQFRAMFDLFNVFNANAVTLEQPGYGPQWLAPQAIMPGRLAKFAFQLDF